VFLGKIGYDLARKAWSGNAYAFAGFGVVIVYLLEGLTENNFTDSEITMLFYFITGAVLGNDALEALPIVEIVPQCDHEYFDFTAKYTAGETREICPARISGAFTNQARELACKAHQALFCKGCSRTDMILCQDRIYVLETNTIPGMTSESLLPLAAKTRGMTFEQLLDRLIELGLERRQADVEKGRDI